MGTPPIPAVDLQPSLAFLRDLSAHNERAWFEQNRSTYTTARRRFERFVDALINAIDPFDPLNGLQAQDCIFRIHRDVRFSRDKTPYQTHFAAAIAAGGRKTQRQAYYIAIEPGDRTMLAGGLYMPSAEQLARIRADLAQDDRDLRSILAEPAFVATFGNLQGEELKTAPQGYDRSHPAIDLLRRKQFYVQRTYTDQAVLSPDFAVTVAAACRVLQPFLAYLDSIL